MPLFTYRCANGHEWDERRDRNDPLLDYSVEPCPACVVCMGQRVKFGSAPAVYFHGRGWSRVDKNYDANGDMK